MPSINAKVIINENVPKIHPTMNVINSIEKQGTKFSDDLNALETIYCVIRMFWD